MKREKEITPYIDTFVDEVQFALRTKNLRQVILSDRGVQPIPTDDSELLMNRVIRLPIYSTPENVKKAANAIADAARQFFEKYEAERNGLEAFPPVMVLIPGEHNYIDGIFDDYPDQYEGFIQGQQADLRADVIRILCDYVQVRDSDGTRKEGFSFTSQQYTDFMVYLWAALQNEKVEGIGCISYSQHGQVVEIYGAVSPFLLSTPATLYAPPMTSQEPSQSLALTYTTEAGEVVVCEGARYGYVLSAEYPLPQYGNPLADVSIDSRYLAAHKVEVNNEKLIFMRLQYGVHHLSRAQRFIRARLESMQRDTSYLYAMEKIEIIITSLNDALYIEGAAAEKIDRFERLANDSIAKIIIFFERIKDGWVLPQGGAKITSNIRIAVPVSEKTAVEKQVFLSLQPMPLEKIAETFGAYKKEQDLDVNRLLANS